MKITGPPLLTLGPGVFLPLEAVTQTFGIVAVRGVGKTHTASVFAEELIGAGCQVVIIDPLDAWWGLRSLADGKPSGLGVYVFGGDHGDLPIEAAAGKLLADVVVEQGISCVLSLRHLSKTAQRRFVADFAERLYDRKGETKHRTPLHLVIDEADAFAPQRVMADTARMLGAIDDCVRRGRNVGFGVTLITQRPATLNKDVLAMIDVLIALRTVSPQDRKALDEWIQAHDTGGRRAEFMASLAGLAIGEAWVWSPAWLDLFVRVKIRERLTFDSSATPKVGQKPLTPARLGAVDLDIIQERMRTVVEEAAAKDPAKLRARIVQLERDLANAAPAAPAQACGHEDEIRELQVGIEIEKGVRVAVGTENAELRRRLEEIAALAGQAPPIMFIPPIPEGVHGRPEGVPRRSRGVPSRYIPPKGVPPEVSEAWAPQGATALERGGLTGPQQRILDVLSELVAIGVGQPQRTIVAALVGYHARTKAFINALGALRTAGHVAYPNSGALQLTTSGAGLATPADPPRSLEDLHGRIKLQLNGPQGRALDVLTAAYPEPVEREELARKLEYHVRTKAFINGLGNMRSMGIIAYPSSGFVAATALLFPEGLR